VNTPRLRVVQWATGNIGLRSLRSILRHPRLELVGVLVYDPAKDGVDAGVLCGEPPAGVAATTDPAAIHALGADCVVHMARTWDVDEVVAFLEAGTNVVTTRGEPEAGGRRLDAADRARLLDACARGGASLYATGSSPGFTTGALSFALLSLQRDVARVEIDEFANLSRRDSPHLLFEQMGFGRPPEAFGDGARAAHFLREFSTTLGAVADAAGMAVDTWNVRGEVATAVRDTELAAGPLAAGTVAAQRTTVVGESGANVVVRFSANWYCTPDVDPAWDLRETGWRVQVHGDAPLDVQITFPVPLDVLGEYTPSYTANPAVNAVPYVCDAAPGILAVEDLPLIAPSGITDRVGRTREGD
jgi:4-hydroxy-tetrahydrodipicolinate reductase